jgi:prepilin-type N-terminal cleavage/methylation domain-containing protein/prepilin-type processing-associated H-X9-DG protein
MKRRTGMSLIELLVVLAIIAILLALLVPAIQRTRDAAARTQCADQVRQIGLACHAYHDTFGTFPPGYHACHSADPMATSPGWGWASYLLPFVEQGSIAQEIAFHKPIEDPENIARRTLVRLYICPADSGLPDTFDITDAYGGFITEAAPTSYAACYGSGELDEVSGPKQGVFHRNSHVALTDISDGTSTTMLIGDRAWQHAMAPWAGAVNRGVIRPGPRNPWPSAAPYPAPNLACFQSNGINRAGDPDGSLDELFSFHRGGANVVFADGSVRFLSEQISTVVLKALGTRAGGEVVNEADY